MENSDEKLLIPATIKENSEVTLELSLINCRK
jgi:hypothetical protein